MSHNSSGIPSPRVSSPYTASTPPSPLEQHHSSLPGHHAPSETPRGSLSPASIDHLSPTYSTAVYPHVAAGPAPNSGISPSSTYDPNLITNSVAGYPPESPSVRTQRPSVSVHQLNRSMYQGHSLPQPPAHPEPQSSSHPYQPPATDVVYQGPTAARPLHLHDTYYQNQGIFSGSHNLSLSHNTFIDNSTTSNSFMEKLLQHTIIGAEFDSSARYPPPRCHPGTRLAIIDRCKVFIAQCNGKEKMRWVVGPVGVGKSAVMQIVAEETTADASVFFSVNERQDGSRLFTTIAYQLAVKYQLYRQFIQKEISDDPSLLHKALPVQFRKFVVDPFIHQRLFDPSRRFVIIIDGLDECDDRRTQREILRLISDSCISYPASPVVWFVASRPEPHITSFFDGARVTPVFTKEEITVDSDEACQDVQHYLREELNEIKIAYPTLSYKRKWPSELEFTKIATAAGGLFAYASAVVRYIDDPHYEDPVYQLRQVLNDIDASSKDDGPGRNHPMAQLDVLYKRILSRIPADAMVNTKKLLFTILSYPWYAPSFRIQCNRLELSEDAAYAAVRHLYAVTRVPAPDQADDENFNYFHKSFFDFLYDFKRSGFSDNAKDETHQLLAQFSLRILEQVPDTHNMASGEGIQCGGGWLKSGPGLCDNVSLSWPNDGRFPTTDDELRLEMYCTSMRDMSLRFEEYCIFYSGISCFHAFTTRFTVPGPLFPVYEIRRFAFGLFRLELMELGRLKQVPLHTLDYAAIWGGVDFRFTSPIKKDVPCSDRWNPSCPHVKVDENGVQHQHGWSTSFYRFLDDQGQHDPPVDIPRFNIKAGKDSHWESGCHGGGPECLYCSQRLARHFIDTPDQLASVFVDSSEICYVELSFVDPDDGMSQWIYRFLHSGPPSRGD